MVTVTSVRIRCKQCGENYPEQMLSGVGFRVLTAYLESLTCPNCHADYKHLGWVMRDPMTGEQPDVVTPTEDVLRAQERLTKLIKWLFANKIAYHQESSEAIVYLAGDLKDVSGLCIVFYGESVEAAIDTLS